MWPKAADEQEQRRFVRLRSAPRHAKRQSQKRRREDFDGRRRHKRNETRGKENGGAVALSRSDLPRTVSWNLRRRKFPSLSQTTMEEDHPVWDVAEQRFSFVSKIVLAHSKGGAGAYIEVGGGEEPRSIVSAQLEANVSPLDISDCLLRLFEKEGGHVSVLDDAVSDAWKRWLDKKAGTCRLLCECCLCAVACRRCRVVLPEDDDKFGGLRVCDWCRAHAFARATRNRAVPHASRAVLRQRGHLLARHASSGGGEAERPPIFWQSRKGEDAEGEGAMCSVENHAAGASGDRTQMGASDNCCGWNWSPPPPELGGFLTAPWGCAAPVYNAPPTFGGWEAARGRSPQPSVAPLGLFPCYASHPLGAPVQAAYVSPPCFAAAGASGEVQLEQGPRAALPAPPEPLLPAELEALIWAALPKVEHPAVSYGTPAEPSALGQLVASLGSLGSGGGEAGRTLEDVLHGRATRFDGAPAVQELRTPAPRASFGAPGSQLAETAIRQSRTAVLGLSDDGATIQPLVAVVPPWRRLQQERTQRPKEPETHEDVTAEPKTKDWGEAAYSDALDFLLAKVKEEEQEEWGDAANNATNSVEPSQPVHGAPDYAAAEMAYYRRASAAASGDDTPEDEGDPVPQSGGEQLVKVEAPTEEEERLQKADRVLAKRLRRWFGEKTSGTSEKRKKRRRTEAADEGAETASTTAPSHAPLPLGADIE
jgi:hypothetical protein